MISETRLSLEQAILGAILLDNGVFKTVNEIVDSCDFADPRHVLIFGAMQELHPGPIDELTLLATLELGDVLQQSGGAKYVGSFIDRIPTAANVIDRIPTAANVEKYALLLAEYSRSN